MLSSELGMEVWFKKEFLQETGSFKERGARYTLLKLTKEQAKVGVVAASAGNHALALCFHGKQLGIPVTVVMPVVAPIMKVGRCRGYGANVIVQGNDIGESRMIAMKMAAELGCLYVNGYDHPNILAGAGTLGLEILDDVSSLLLLYLFSHSLTLPLSPLPHLPLHPPSLLVPLGEWWIELPDLDAIIVPIGGGGLIAGVACAIKTLKPDVHVIGVEAEMCPSFTNAMAAGKPVYTKPESTLADGLSVPVVGVNAFATARDLVDRVVTVNEFDIARTCLRLVEVEKAVVEGAGLVGFAALLSGQLNDLKGCTVVFPLCGGNIDTTVLGRSLDRGLAAEGRLIRFTVIVSDRPGGIAELTTLLAKVGASIKDMFHERAWLKTDIFSVRVKVVAETRDWDHCREIEAILRSKYSEVIFSYNFLVHTSTTDQLDLA